MSYLQYEQEDMVYVDGSCTIDTVQKYSFSLSPSYTYPKAAISDLSFSGSYASACTGAALPIQAADITPLGHSASFVYATSTDISFDHSDSSFGVGSFDYTL